jgi:hypothetical protein
VKCGPCTFFESYTLVFALQLRKKHGKSSVRVVEKCPDIPVAVGSGVPRGGLGVSNPTPLKFRSFDKAEPNSQFRGKYIPNNIIRIRISLI